MNIRLLCACALLTWSASAAADCWRVPGGQIIQTAPGSTPPVRGAQRVQCPPPAVSSFRAPAPSRPVQPQAPAPREEPRGITTSDRRPYSGECTDFARAMVPSLPHGLTSYADKLRIINDHSPRVGSVAVIEVPGGTFAEYGHVAVVVAITPTSITLAEAHFGGRYSEERRAVGTNLTDAERQLHIVGYFRP